MPNKLRLPLLLSLAFLPAFSCGGPLALKQPAQAVVQAARPELSPDLIAEAWRENARRDSLRIAQMQAKASGVTQSFNDQIKAAEQAAAQLVETTHPLTVLGGEPPPVKPADNKLGAKVEQVLGAITQHGQELRSTGREVGEALRQMQELTAQVQEIRQTQQQLAAAVPSEVAQQAPAGVLGIITLILAILLRAAHKKNKQS